MGLKEEKMEKEKKSWFGIDKVTFLLPAICLIPITIFGAAFPEKFGEIANVVMNWCTTNMGWFFAVGATACVVFAIWLGLSKYGKIVLGGKEAKPDMSFFKWFCISLTAAIATGLVYWGVAEPMTYFMDPPVFTGAEPGSYQAAEQSLRFVFLHWCLHPFSMNVVTGVAIGFMYWNGKRPFSVSSALYPMLGEKANGKIQNWVNGLCILGLMAGLGTSLGMSIDQLVSGLSYATGLQLNPQITAMAFAALFAVFSIVCASSGVHKGISYVSTTNVYVFLMLLVFSLCFGGTRFILNNTITSIGQYFQNFIGQTLYLEPAYQSGWVNKWTVFYWCWWFAFTVMIGLFNIKLAKGRTIRQYVVVNLLAPAIFLLAWFGVFGSSAIHMTLNGNTAIADTLAEKGSSFALFAYLEQLPLGKVLMILALVAIFLSLATQTESQTLTISDLCMKKQVTADTNEDTHFSPVGLKAFWGIAMVVIAIVLLSAGGLQAVQTSSVIVGFPMLILIILMMISCAKGLKNYKKYDKTLPEGEDYE